MNNAKVNIVGRIIADATTRTDNNTTRVVFPVSVNTDHKAEGAQYYDSDIYNVSWYGKQAENCMKFLTKGATVSVWGHMSLRAYTDKKTNKPAASATVKAFDVFVQGKAATAAPTPKPAPVEEEEVDPFAL